MVLARGRCTAAGWWVEKVGPEQVRQRIQTLRRYRWSSYRSYIGSAKVPSWLVTEAVLRLGGSGAKVAEHYREYCEQAIRQGAQESPWDRTIGQAVLGTERFVAGLAKTFERGELGKRLAKRPKLDEVIKLIEGIKGEKWEAFRDRHGDSGRDLVL